MHNMLKILSAIFIVFLTSCNVQERNYFENLGKMHCKYHEIVQQKMELIHNDQVETEEYDSLSLESEYVLGILESELEKLPENVEKYGKSVDEIEKDFRKGYKKCDCDTCLFKGMIIVPVKEAAKKKTIAI